MGELPIWFWFLFGLIDGWICYRIIFHLIHWDAEKYRSAFWIQIVVIAIVEALWNSGDYLSEHRLWITVTIQFVVAALLLPHHRLRALTGIVAVKMLEMLYILSQVIIYEESLEVSIQKGLTIERVAFVFGLALLFKLGILLLIRWLHFRFFKVEITQAIGKDYDLIRYRYTWISLSIGFLSSILLLASWKHSLLKSFFDFTVLFISSTALCLLAFVWMKRTDEQLQNQLKQEQLDLQSKQLEQVQTLFTALRSERHDFVNHIQVLNGLIQTHRFEQAEKYLAQLSSDVRMMNQVLVKGQPVLSALLQAKMGLCMREGIDLEINIRDDLQSVAWKPTEMITLIGNVITNAIEAYTLDPNMNERTIRKIWISTIAIDADRIELEIGNFAKEIPADLLGQMIKPGVTNKEGHAGIGLASVHQIIYQIQGRMNVSSDSVQGTRFRFELPIR